MSLFTRTISIAAILGVGAFSLYAQNQAPAASGSKSMTHMTMTGHHHNQDSMMTAKEQDTKAADSSKVKSTLAPQTTCPVMGAPVNKKIYADYKGKRVYFCCNMCPATFKKDPEKYIKKLASSGQSAETILVPQTTCPVMGGPINKDIHADYKGKRVYFCCNMCVATFNKEPETYIKKLESEGQSMEIIATRNKKDTAEK